MGTRTLSPHVAEYVDQQDPTIAVTIVPASSVKDPTNENADKNIIITAKSWNADH